MPAQRRSPRSLQQTILVVDSDARSRYTVRFNLEEWGYRVVTYAAPTDLRAMLEAQRADLLLLDLKLPDWDDFDLCRAIRELSEIPIIALSASPRQADKVRAFDLGVDDYLQTPYAPGELVRRIMAVLQSAERRTAAIYLPALPLSAEPALLERTV